MNNLGEDNTDEEISDIEAAAKEDILAFKSKFLELLSNGFGLSNEDAEAHLTVSIIFKQDDAGTDLLMKMKKRNDELEESKRVSEDKFFDLAKLGTQFKTAWMKLSIFSFLKDLKKIADDEEEKEANDSILGKRKRDENVKEQKEEEKEITPITKKRRV